MYSCLIAVFRFVFFPPHPNQFCTTNPVKLRASRRRRRRLHLRSRCPSLEPSTITFTRYVVVSTVEYRVNRLYWLHTCFNVYECVLKRLVGLFTWLKQLYTTYD